VKKLLSKISERGGEVEPKSQCWILFLEGPDAKINFEALAHRCKKCWREGLIPENLI